MNEYQEVYERLTSEDYKYKDIESVYKDLEVLKPLVDKATPKKVEKNIEGASYCPNCKVVVANKNIINDLNYCHYCGQAISWENE